MMIVLLITVTAVQIPQVEHWPQRYVGLLYDQVFARLRESRDLPEFVARCAYCTCTSNDAVSMRPARLNCRKMR
jgi:hypothetical protein